MQVIPVAGRDSMLLNLSGAHAPFFTRNIVILTDNAGHTGVGEVPGGEKIRQTLEDARALVVGQTVGDLQQHPRAMRTKFADRDAGGRGKQTLRPAHHDPCRHGASNPRCSICSASTSTCRSPRCSAKASSATRVEMLGYLFFVGDRRKTDLAYATGEREQDDWFTPAPRGGDDARGRRAARRSDA